MSWYTSDRRSRLPRNWPALVAATKKRAHGKCQAKQHTKGCNRIGTECDHIISGDDHSMNNLQWLSAECHKTKTQAEAAQNNTARAAMRRRPPEPHPGSVR